MFWLYTCKYLLDAFFRDVTITFNQGFGNLFNLNVDQTDVILGSLKKLLTIPINYSLVSKVIWISSGTYWLSASQHNSYL